MACYESGPDGTRVEDSQFDIKLIGPEKSLRRSYCPYMAKDKHAGTDAKYLAYSKPFLMAQISPKPENTETAWTLTEDRLWKYFRCELLADNLSRPITGPDFYKSGSDIKAVNNDLTKLSLGFAQFGFTFDEKK
jgi:hypothetical protein